MVVVDQSVINTDKSFYFNAFLMLSNGLEAKVGTMGSKYEFFHEWKRLKEDEVGAVDLETMLAESENE